MQATRTHAPVDKELDASTSTNFETGLKLRSQKWTTDLALYYTKLNDEIVSKNDGGNDYYVNAGETDKKGIELSTAYRINPNWSLGFSGSRTEYSYVDYVTDGVDYSGNTLRFSPDYQYSVFVDWRKGDFSTRIETTGVGEYYMDDANTEKYDGYSGVTHLTMGYNQKGHSVNLSVHNLTDEHYASEVSKTAGFPDDKYYYTPGAPRNIMLSYQYKY